MRPVSVTRRVRLKMIVTTVLGTLVATAAAQGVANAQAPPVPAPPVVVQENNDSWLATGFVGSSFSAGGDLAIQTNTSDGGVTFGGQIARTWGYVGAEFIADFAPTFKTTSLLLSDDPTVNSYMLNVIAKAPLGAEGRFQPYVSGGLGAISMRTSTFTLAGTTVVPGNTVTLNTVNDTQSKFGSDIGGGFFAFANRWGIRGDIRYYRTSTFDQAKLTNGTVASDFTQALLSGLTFWRANLGIAYRW